MGKKLKPVPKGNKGLKKLPTEVRNKMGFMRRGGKVAGPKKYSKKPIKEVQSDAYKSLPGRSISNRDVTKVKKLLQTNSSKPYKPLPGKLSSKNISDIDVQRVKKVLKKNKGGLVKGGTSAQMTGKRYKGTF